MQKQLNDPNAKKNDSVVKRALVKQDAHTQKTACVEWNEISTNVSCANDCFFLSVISLSTAFSRLGTFNRNKALLFLSLCVLIHFGNDLGVHFTQVSLVETADK